MQVTEQAARLVALRGEKDRIEDDLKRVKGDIAEVEAALITAMTEDDVQNFTAHGSLFSLGARQYASCDEIKMPTLVRRLRARKFGRLVKTSVNSQTLSAFVKEQTTENAGQIPAWLADIVEVYTKKYISIRKK